MFQSVVHWNFPFSRYKNKKLDKKDVSNGMRVEVLMVVTMNNTVLWNVILCSMVEI
jgi:hypothetical protein